MKVIIAGSRSITDYSLVEQAVIGSGFEITEVVSGTPRGVDRLGELWAAEHFVPVKRFDADWMTSILTSSHTRCWQPARLLRKNKRWRRENLTPTF